MEREKLLDITNDVINKSNKDLVIVADELSEEFEKTKELMDLVYDDKLNPRDCAFISHHIFEVIHTFIDGNGNISTTNMAALTLGSATTGSIQLSPKGTTGLFVNGVGNVGIGTIAPL